MGSGGHWWPGGPAAESVRGGRPSAAAGLSQEALAHAAGVHFTTVSLVERGRRAPSIVVAQGLAAALGLRLSELFAEVEAAGPSPRRRRGRTS